jgi:hypothetical protein
MQNMNNVELVPPSCSIIVKWRCVALNSLKATLCLYRKELPHWDMLTTLGSMDVLSASTKPLTAPVVAVVVAVVALEAAMAVEAVVATAVVVSLKLTAINVPIADFNQATAAVVVRNHRSKTLMHMLTMTIGYGGQWGPSGGQGGGYQGQGGYGGQRQGYGDQQQQQQQQGGGQW